MSTGRWGSRKRSEMVEALKWSGRRESRASLMFRHSVAERAGLHVTDAECIDFLMEAGTATAGDLARAAGLTTGAMTAAIDRLERAGFVYRDRDPSDRRKVIVKPVMKTIKKYVPLYESMGREVEKLFSEYTDEELEFLLEHSNRMTKIYEEQIARLRQGSRTPKRA